jgi:ABC-type Fe3+/spermidine/putrescine transport system ATPase subunit
VRIGGRDVARLPPYKRDVNTVFQSYALFPHLSVLENVAYGLKQRGLGKNDRCARAREMLELVRLGGFEASWRSSSRTSSCVGRVRNARRR